MKNQIIQLIIISVSFFISIDNLHAQTEVFIDDFGVMRWGNSKQEVSGFGVNYTVPFAHAYRTANRLGIDPKKAIDNDVYHFTRLGFDLYRIHVWDTQISDEKGNLIENEYLDTFDYLLKTLKEHNINYVITPIAFWGDGWPEPDSETPGFSNKYGKNECLTNPDAIKAQQNYLFQFINHINPYNGLSYKDDPNTIAFEVSNEPHHRGMAKDVTTFVKSMVKAIKRTGTKKPIFYNMSHGVHFADAYFKGGAEGGTFQWYPTGLGYQRELSGNLLPNVDNYNIPFEDTIKKNKGAKLVYEFDAADVGKSYIYPAMARSFREAGIQIATHFAYDPTYMADVNTEYNTHYMNLAYTPQKALSLKICAEVFKEIPMYADYGTYPDNTSFGNFKVDYEKDLAVYNTINKFFYTNSTETLPKQLDSLTQIAGYGNSIVVKYDGKGAYFLDQLNHGLWRLEVMPDAVWVNNPFGKNSPKKIIGVIKWNRHDMSINIEDIGESFDVIGINDGNNFSTKSTNRSFQINPGTYILQNKNTAVGWTPSDSFNTGKLLDFYAPSTNVTDKWLIHKPLIEASTDLDLTIKVQYISPVKPDQIKLYGYLNGEQLEQELEQTAPYAYECKISKQKLKDGFLNYHIEVKTKDSFMTYPATKKGKPRDWDFYDLAAYRIPLVNTANPIFLFNALEDSELIVRSWRPGFKLIPGIKPYQAEYQIHLEKLHYSDNENLNELPVYNYSMKHFIIDKIKGRKNDLGTKTKLIIEARSLNNRANKMEIALVTNDGSSYGKVLSVDVESNSYEILLSDLKLVETVTLPRPYPTFLPYYFEHENTFEFNINEIESVQLSFGDGTRNSDITESIDIGLTSIYLK